MRPVQVFAQDLRFAIRQFLKRPGFTITAVLILALGLGANTAIFSVLNVFLLHPLPFRQPDRLVAVWERNVISNGDPYNWVAPGTYYDWQKLSTSFDQISAYFRGPVTVGNSDEGAQPQRIDAAGVPANLFTTLGVSPLMGRTFSPDEDSYPGKRNAVIGYGLWQSRFGGVSDIIGKTIRIDGFDSRVIGIMPKGFAYPARTTQVWLPFDSFMPPTRKLTHDTHFLRVVARLRPGVTIGQAQAELSAINAHYKSDHPTEIVSDSATVQLLQSSLTRDLRSSLWILFGAVCCVLLIACVNVANLLLARASGRTREVAIRSAIGASRGRIVQQLLIESTFLAVAGGAIGAVLAVWLTQFLALHVPEADTILSAADVPVDGTVFLFTFGIALLTGIAAGLFPAIQSARVDLAAGLKETSRSATPSRAQGRFRSTLVTAEVALSLVLLIAAGLLFRSFSELRGVQPGVRMDHTLTLTIPLLAEPVNQKLAFLRDLPDQLATVPGVISAGLSTCLPLGGHCGDSVFLIEGRPQTPGRNYDVLERQAGPGYFTAAGIALLRGRTFTVQDGIGLDQKHPKPGAIVISESLAKTFFPNEEPIGKRLTMASDVARQRLANAPVPVYQIIGVVGDVRADLDKSPEPTMYRPILDSTNYDAVYVTLHTSADPRSVVAGVRQQINRADAQLAVDDIRTMPEVAGEAASGHEFTMMLFGSFAALALLLAAAGLYAVLSYTVSQRKGEIGIRMALGASNSEVSGWVLRQGLKPAIAGVVLGLIAAALAVRILKALLYGVQPFDPITFAVLPMVLLGIAALACYVPALRATRIDPTVTLRME